jgi:hypothetical protein
MTATGEVPVSFASDERLVSAHRRRPTSSKAGWAFHAKLMFSIGFIRLIM